MFAFAIRRARTASLLGSEKWSTPGFSDRLKRKHGIACQLRIAVLVVSS